MILNKCKKYDSILWTSNDEYKVFGYDMKSVIEKLENERNSVNTIVKVNK